MAESEKMESDELVLNQNMEDEILNSSTVSTSEFDTDEEEQDFDISPLHMDWIDLKDSNIPGNCLAISALPGCRFSKIWRSLDHDIESIKSQGITNVMVFCTKGDLYRYRVKNLLEKYTDAGLEVHNFPHEDMQDPEIDNLLKIFDQLEINMSAGKKTLLHCYAGLGRSCLVAACLLMYHNPELDPEKAIEIIRGIRGPKAVQSVKQYNFITDFRKELKEFIAKTDEKDARAVSR